MLGSCLWRGYVPAGDTYLLCSLFVDAGNPETAETIQRMCAIKSRCNIISQLAGTDWGVTAHVLRTSAIALVSLNH